MKAGDRLLKVSHLSRERLVSGFHLGEFIPRWPLRFEAWMHVAHGSMVGTIPPISEGTGCVSPVRGELLDAFGTLRGMSIRQLVGFYYCTSVGGVGGRKDLRRQGWGPFVDG